VRRLLLTVVVAVGLLVAPAAASAQTVAEQIAADVDAWWAGVFAAMGIPYGSPQLEIVTAPGTEFCGAIDTYQTPGGYCPSNQTIFLSTAFGDPDSLVWLPVIAHEWGHHVQQLMDTGVRTVVEAELQDDCFAGAFVASAQDADWISPVVSALALQLTQSAGDVWWLYPDEPLTHGTKADRAVAFMAGLNGGVDACWL
jgi:uncharacterized protein